MYILLTCSRRRRRRRRRWWWYHRRFYSSSFIRVVCLLLLLLFYYNDTIFTQFGIWLSIKPKHKDRVWMFGKRKVGSRRAAEPLEKIIESCALRKNRFAESKCKDSASAVPRWFLVISGGFAGKWRKKSFLHRLVSRKSFIRKHIDTFPSNFITSSFHLLFCFFISLKKRMFFRQARGSACKAVVAFYYYSSVRCLTSKASINFFQISNPPKNARFSLFSLCFTQTACYFQSEEDKSAL